MNYVWQKLEKIPLILSFHFDAVVMLLMADALAWGC